VLEKYGVKRGIGARGRAAAGGARVFKDRMEPEAYLQALGRRRRQLSLDAASAGMPTPDAPDEDEDDREQACHACKACTASNFCGCRDDDSEICCCACDACKTCENRGGAKDYQPSLARRRQLLLAAANTVAEANSRRDPDWILAIARRRRQLEQMI
jgi:hypothetical protein